MLVVIDSSNKNDTSYCPFHDQVFLWHVKLAYFPPREPPFEPKPSLYPVCEYLIEQCIKRYAKEKCPLCNERVLPQKPEVRCFFRLLYWVLLKPDVCDLDGFCINYKNKSVQHWDSNYFFKWHSLFPKLNLHNF